ncbi:ferredoxin [Amycolatopsis sp. WAC 04169]|uniref:Ferredoxin n=1 Tax=Amycolatopsis keratiniphila subsp. keratiniphila TaxID=227715 RepID=A0A1W2LXG4_9PSEU|nr:MULTISPECIES: ferredoxin [Amycolatopsis]OLZ48630.1 ferredoxin [Amycolatopsis keratiniphila subsp. nogabecina]ONF71587.1 ferredoxin [Amycolatopsis keratiniphila subsp. keratiniphila]RSN33831.1 ferredoxin [Amycolatopsis sp. WAC 04169]SDU35990.1 ferredoxin [Amycolatopsis keratiniphila]
MEIGVDRSLCEANAICVGFAPEVFDLDDDEELVLASGEVPQNQVERVTQAVASCPKNALLIRG